MYEIWLWNYWKDYQKYSSFEFYGMNNKYQESKLSEQEQVECTSVLKIEQSKSVQIDLLIVWTRDVKKQQKSIVKKSKESKKSISVLTFVTSFLSWPKLSMFRVLVLGHGQ